MYQQKNVVLLTNCYANNNKQALVRIIDFSDVSPTTSVDQLGKQSNTTSVKEDELSKLLGLKTMIALIK